MPDVYDANTQDSTGGEGKPPATPAPEASSAPEGNAGLTTASPSVTTQIAQVPQETLTPPERALKNESWGTKLYHGVLNALGGGGDVSYSRDPKTGKMIATPVQTGPGTQWKKIIAGALSGFAGAAQAGTTGPGGGIRGAGAGVAAGINLARQREAAGREQANEDYEAAQKNAMQSAQLSLLNHQIATSTFDLGRANIDASVQDSERETNFERVISDGGEGSVDMGVFPDFQAVMKAFKEVPELHDHQAGGRIVSIPHISADGKVDGVHAALVSPSWLESKINRDLPIVTRTFKDGKMEEQTFTVPAGTLTGQQYSQMVMAQSKDALDDWTKTAATNLAQERENTEGPLRRAQTAEAYAAADHDRAEALLSEAKAAAENSGSEVDWGPGGAKGFDSWHDKNVTPALGTEKLYRLASNVYNEYANLRKHGKDFPSGAQSVQMLSYHIANTFGNVKGARITKDLIEKHLGARGISDAAAVAINKLRDGDQLSPKQWDAFFSMAGNTRDETWRSVLDDAESLGRPLDYIAFPQDLRTRWGLGPGRVGQPLAAPGARPSGAAPANAPPANLLKEGVNTTLKGPDNQMHIWTLKNGTPTEVQSPAAGGR